MRAAEILRRVADIIDAKENNTQAGAEINNRPAIANVAVSEPIDAQGIESQAQVNVKPMVSPLQLQAELLKQVTGQGTDTKVCPECGASPCGCEEEPDAVIVLKRNAGI
jgi:hypothetical protein